MVSNSEKLLKKYLKKKSKISKKAFQVFFVLVVFLGIILYGSLKTYAMSSANYNIPKDSINIGGTEGSSSATYDLSDTMGEDGAGLGSSATYDLNAGFRPDRNKPKLQFSLSGNNVALGVLSKGSVSTGNVVATVTTNAKNGYLMAVIADGGLRKSGGEVIADVADGSVTAGSSEYGLSTSGADGLFNASDTSVTTSLKNIASNSSGVVNSATTINFKASIDGTEAPGSYNQKVTVICTGSF